MAASTKTTSTEPVVEPEYDFDTWSEADEEKAIAALVPDVRYIIVEKVFIGRFVDGTIVKVPLSISLDDVDGLQEGYASPIDQFKKLLTTVGGEAAAKEFSSHDLTETAILSEKFFTILQRIQKVALPE